MVNYVNTVLVSNLTSGAVLSAAPAAASSLNSASTDAGKFIIMNCDPNVASNAIYNVTAGNALDIQTIKVGIVTKKNLAIHKPDGTVEFQPIVKWSNEIKAADIKSYNTLEYTADTEDTVTIDFSNLAAATLTEFAKGGKRIIVRLTFKDMPHRYRKWTESYEYVTEAGDTKATIAQNIGKMINKEWKRARVSANTATTNKVILTAMPYDDDDNVDSLNWANKVRFNANIYWTDPAGEGWEANNKHFPQGVTIAKVPGKQYPASAKLVRDRESWAMGYLGILNRGEGTWPIIKPDMETNLDAHYDAITLEFENMYRAADDIQRKTKQTLEVYGITGQLSGLQAILTSFVSGTSSSADAGQNTAIAGKASQSDLDALASRVDALVNAQNNG
ncbi:MAG: hypothetical protein VZQ98_11290 [Bacteroidales bacterium]|nr:hypothetical protein [Bacteroidales bacterium]